jgi:hypothetical protein
MTTKADKTVRPTDRPTKHEIEAVIGVVKQLRLRLCRVLRNTKWRERDETIRAIIEPSLVRARDFGFDLRVQLRLLDDQLHKADDQFRDSGREPWSWEKTIRAAAGVGEPHEALRTLGLDGDNKVTAEEINAAYKELAKKHHPDRGGDEEEFKKLHAAYEEAMRHHGEEK